MEKRINIAELLKNCPKETQLYSPICGECRVIKIYDLLGFDVINETDDVFKFSYDGRYNLMGECCIFPSKENKDWSTFKRPFKNGDVVATEGGHWIGITEGGIKNSFISTYCILKSNGQFEAYFDEKRKWHFSRLATEEEKQKLFKVIEKYGYKWNAETKTLEKLIIPKFKVGDRIRRKGSCKNGLVTCIDDPENFYTVEYDEGEVFIVNVEYADDWELASNKFDVNTLKPFDKVLVRDGNEQKWTVDMFSFYDKNLTYPFVCVGHYTNQCIPYESNEHLLDTTNDCDDFYKTWEK